MGYRLTDKGEEYIEGKLTKWEAGEEGTWALRYLLLSEIGQGGSPLSFLGKCGSPDMGRQFGMTIYPEEFLDFTLRVKSLVGKLEKEGYVEAV